MTTRFAAILLALLCGLLPLRAGAQESELSGVIVSPEFQARELEKAGDWSALEKAAAAWSEQDGADWQSWYYYGLAELRLGRADSAVRHLTLARELLPQEYLKLDLMIADAHAMVPNWEVAERAYRKLLLTNENSPLLWDKLRDLLERYLESLSPEVREHSEAAQRVQAELIDVLGRTLQFRDYRRQAELWQRHAGLLRAHQRDAEARKSYTRYLVLRPTDLEVWEWVFKHDLTHADAATLAKTVAYMEKVDANNPHLRVYQAQQAQAAQNKQEARHHYTVASGNGGYPRQQALAFAGLGDLTEGRKHGVAMNYYKRAIQADPSYVHAWERIVVILRAQKRHTEARKFFSHLRLVKEHLRAEESVPRTVLQGLNFQENKN